MDLFLTILSAAFQALTAYWGYQLSVEPPETPRQRRFFKWAFILIGVCGIAITSSQQWRNGREEAELKSEITDLRKSAAATAQGIKKVEEQTKAPAVRVDVQPAPVTVVPLPPKTAATPAPRPKISIATNTVKKVTDGYEVLLSFGNTGAAGVQADVNCITFDKVGDDVRETSLRTPPTWLFDENRGMGVSYHVRVPEENDARIRSGTMISGVRCTLDYPDGKVTTRYVFEGILWPGHEYLNVTRNERTERRLPKK
jgi:hypothetical protein